MPTNVSANKNQSSSIATCRFLALPYCVADSISQHLPCFEAVNRRLFWDSPTGLVGAAEGQEEPVRHRGRAPPHPGRSAVSDNTGSLPDGRPDSTPRCSTMRWKTAGSRPSLTNVKAKPIAQTFLPSMKSKVWQLLVRQPNGLVTSILAGCGMAALAPHSIQITPLPAFRCRFFEWRRGRRRGRVLVS